MQAERAVGVASAARFRARFGRSPELAVRAPGRVNLIGEHTDYNEGLVLPCAIDRHTVVMAASRDDGRVRVYSHEQAELRSFEAASPVRSGDWIDYVQGVVAALGERGVDCRGLDLTVASEVPAGAGLASSAALAVAVVTAIDGLEGLGLGPMERARVAHRAESGFVGVPCGPMDPLASALGRAGAALRIDCRLLDVRPVELPAGLQIVIADSGVRRALVAGDYADRRAECARALGALQAAGSGARALRDLSLAELEGLRGRIEPRLWRRARHVVTENARVEATSAALAAGRLDEAGSCLREGMRSLREDFEVSTPELDHLCELADACPGVHGSRLTGAGFGGCTVHLVASDAVEQVCQAISRGFEARFGRTPALHTVAASEAAAVFDPNP